MWNIEGNLDRIGCGSSGPNHDQIKWNTNNKLE